MKIEVGKIYRSRNGQRVRVVDTSGHGSHPIAGWSTSCSDNSERLNSYTADGRFYLSDETCPLDIVEEIIEPDMSRFDMPAIGDLP